MEKKENIKIGKNSFIENDASFHDIKDSSKIDIGENVKIYGYTKFLMKENAKISIGDNSIIAGGVFTATDEIRVGKNVIISYYVSIMDSDFHSTDQEIRKKETIEFAPPTNHEYMSPDIISKPVIIEDDVKIGANSIILKGVTIGKGSEIAAGSVVAKNIPEYSYAEGNPVIIRKIND